MVIEGKVWSFFLHGMETLTLRMSEVWKVERAKESGLGGLETLQGETRSEELPPERVSLHMYVRLIVLS